MVPEFFRYTALAITVAGFSAVSAGFNNSATADGSFVPKCETRDSVIASLANEYSEEPVSRGYTAQGTIIEILASPDGNWTMIETSTNDITCLVANGQMWHDMENTSKTSAISDPLL